MSIGFRIVNREFLRQLERYIRLNATVEKKNFMDVPNKILKANITYQYLCTITNKDLTLQEIYGKHPDLGLIGPGQGLLTRILEKLFGSSKNIWNACHVAWRIWKLLLGFWRRTRICLCITFMVTALFERWPIGGTNFRTTFLLNVWFLVWMIFKADKAILLYTAYQ